MSQLSEKISQRIEKEGGNTSAVARKLEISSQLLGRYARGEITPKAQFILKWKQVFNEELLYAIDQGENEPNEIAISTTMKEMATDILQLKAIVSTLSERLAISEALRTGRNADEVLLEMEHNTKLRLKALAQKSS